MKKCLNKRLAAIFLVLLCVSLTGCAPAPKPAPSVTLPPVAEDIVAPVGDAALAYAGPVALYLPSRDGQRLICQYETVALHHGRHPAEAVARALLAHPGNAEVLPLGGDVTLQLAASDPIELSGEVCTVNLTPSALQLDHDAFYTACQGLAATLCELPGIHAVNVLVAGESISLDAADCLPVGCVSPRVGVELPVLWSQMAARRTPVGDDPSQNPLTAAAILYFPLSSGDGIVCEARTLSFPGQSPEQLTLGLMDALAAGPVRSPDAAALPSASSLLASAPEARRLDSGGRTLTLHFVPELEERLSASNVDFACFLAALTDTLTGFVPSVTAVCMDVGGQPLTSVYNAALGSLLFPDGVVKREDFSAYPRMRTTLYLPLDGHLKRVSRSLPDDDAFHPRTLLRALMTAPSAAEREAGFAPLLPEGLSDADILGLSVVEDTLLVNLSARTAEAIRVSGLDQHLMCRGLVSALCEQMGTRRVRFFFGGDAAQTLDGPIFWGGEFLYSSDLTETAGGG